MRRRKAILLVSVAAACLLVGAAPARSPAVRRVTARGTPEQIGQEIGASCGATVRRLHSLFLAAAVIGTRRSKQALYARASDIAQHISDEDIREMTALAKAADMDYADVLFLNVWYSLLYSKPFCRQIALWDDWTADGELIHARNLDWLDSPGRPLQKNNLILNVRPGDGIEYMILTWPGLVCALTGTNRKGLTIAFNQLAPGSVQGRLAEPVFFTLKRVLRSCASVEEALDLIREARPLGNGSILISDAGRREAAVVDVFDGHVGVRRAEGGIIGNANHITTDLALRGKTPGSGERPVCEVARELGKGLAPEDVERLMSHPRVMQPINLVSVIFQPARNRMFLACGSMPAAEGVFHRYTLFPEKAHDQIERPVLRGESGD